MGLWYMTRLLSAEAWAVHMLHGALSVQMIHMLIPVAFVYLSVRTALGGVTTHLLSPIAPPARKMCRVVSLEGCA